MLPENFKNYEVEFGEVLDFIDVLSPKFKGVKRSVAVLASLSLAYIIQDPGIHPEVLVRDVKEASEFIAMQFAARSGSDQVTEGKGN